MHDKLFSMHVPRARNVNIKIKRSKIPFLISFCRKIRAYWLGLVEIITEKRLDYTTPTDISIYFDENDYAKLKDSFEWMNIREDDDLSIQYVKSFIESRI